MERAEALVAEGSYALAYKIYLELDGIDLPPDEARWIDFRLADTLWRSQAATEQTDDTQVERARQQLEALVRDVSRVEDRDRVWVEVQESLGDFWWERRGSQNWGQGWSHYQQALDWWAGSAEIDEARERYLAMVWTAARPPWVEPYYYYGYYGNQLPLNVLHNVLKISDDPDDRSHAYYLMAMTMRGHGGDAAQHRRTREAFESALAAGRKAEWYDDALYHYAQWLEQGGRVERLEGGRWRRVPDYVAALTAYRRLTREFVKGETRYFDDAKRRIAEITRPSVGVAVSNYFLPGSEVQYHLSWRNVPRVELALYPIELLDDVNLQPGGGTGNWLDRAELRGRSPVRSWSWETNDRGDHVPGQEVFTLEDKPETGAYVIVARASGQTSRDLLLVTGVAVVLKSSANRALAYVCDAVSGAPRANATVTLWVRAYDNQWRWTPRGGRTDEDGLVVFDLSKTDRNRELFLVAADGAHQTFASGNSWSRGGADEGWRIYAFTDRPAYRPGEETRWKVVARRKVGGSYVTPADEVLWYDILDPRGTRVSGGRLDLNRFGSAWASLPLDATMPLGEYPVIFRLSKDGEPVGGANLFRLEEYKLPEFKVEVRTPTEDDRKRTFELGETVEIDVVAEYYFGGPVADATAEVLVYQKPLYIWWQPRRDFPWFYEDMTPRHGWWGGPGQIVHRETVPTDAGGRARVSFQTPADSSQDFEYTVEVRVTDASRREIVGRGTVRVSRQPYFAFLRARHHLFRPGDDVRVDVRTLDANERPIRAEGRVRVTRDRWVEVWLDPRGREITGSELDKMRRREPQFPPPARPGEHGWRLRSSGYEHEDVTDTVVRTGEDGTAELVFTADREGYYRIAWTSEEDARWPVNAETTVWVADPDTIDVGYHHGGVGIILDEDTFRAGTKVPVMLTAPVRDSYVLFSIEAEDLLDYRVVHLTGTVKLIEIDVTAGHVPNVFLDAAMVQQTELFMDSKQVIVPPVEHFLEVEVTADREEYQPREKGTLTITTRDHEGRPVAAEVGLALVDQSVLYIQQDYAPDPRPFFFGDKRPKWVRTQSSLHHKRFARLARNDKGEVVDYAAVVSGVGGREDAFASAAAPAEMRRMQAPALKKSTAEGYAAEEILADADMEQTVAGNLAVPGGEEPAVQVRTDFRATALWRPDVVTGDDGKATVEVAYPDSLTTWVATAKVATAGNRFGVATSTTRTQKPLIVRLQAPRFFVVGDTVTLSAVINNNTESDLAVSPKLEAEGLVFKAAGDGGSRVIVPAGGERRVDWIVEVHEAGTARLTATARGGELADAMERSYPVYEHGIEKFVSRSGKVRGDDVTVRIDLPDRREGSTTMTVQVTPSLAVTMLDALPYLIDYPYGCTEQTMSRFLPAVITARTLERLGLEPGDISGHIFGGIESAHAHKTHPKGTKDLAELDKMVRTGLQRLYDFQHGDGGWGWWKEGESDPFMTAYVVWGLGLAREAGVEVDTGVLQRGAGFLDKELIEAEDRPDLQAWMLHALSSLEDSRRSPRSKFQARAFENLWSGRDRLNAYTRALLALSAHHFGDDERARTLVRNLENGVKRDDAPDASVIVKGMGSGSSSVIGTAHWGQDGIYWRWSDGAVESTSFVLRALLAIDPDNDLIEPVMNWLIKNRRGAQWSNTRDTAMTVLTMVDYLETSGELGSTLDYEVLVNDRSVARRRVTPAEILAAPSRFAVDPSWLRDDINEIRIVRRGGDGPIYFAAQAEYFSLEEPIAPAGNEIFVRRSYYKLVGQPTLLEGYVYDKQPLDDLGTVGSGERVQVVVTVEGKNDYEYLVFEDLKPAGFEAVQLRSGEPLYARELKSGAIDIDPAERDPSDYTGRTRWVYQELRDRKVAMFIDKLPEGVWELRYDLRAEVPGKFHALPLMGHAMYVPEIRANGAETRIQVIDE
jgi:uncharacterized protein YfaS (alpha-2-macroglobulin family)